MKTARADARPKRKSIRLAQRPAQNGLIHPVVIYPFQSPDDYSDLAALFELVSRLDSEKHTYARPITVMDCKTHSRMARNKEFLRFRQNTVARCSDLMDAWCVDTCQMWYSGLGKAFALGRPGHVYWLIPGDFNYGASVGQEVLQRLHDLPEIVSELEVDLCIGEIATDHSHSKQLIDTYGTFALLYTWFPSEAQEIRQYTERPRSEFFALRHSFLGEVLERRWYPHEQTVVMLLHAIWARKRIARFFVGNISDLPEGRESFASAVQQVERTERVLKSLWTERNSGKPGWSAEYNQLVSKSEQVRRAALTVLQNLLGD